MSLKDKLLSKVCREQTLVVDGESYLIRELSRSRNGQLRAEAFNKKDFSLNTTKWENSLCAESVLDPETKSPVMSAEEWNELPNSITVPFIEAVVIANGLRDVEPKQEVKDAKN